MDDGGDYDKDEENCINDELSMRGRKEGIKKYQGRRAR